MTIVFFSVFIHIFVFSVLFIYLKLNIYPLTYVSLLYTRLVVEWSVLLKKNFKSI